MQKILLALCALGLSGCAEKPFEPTKTIYEPSLMTRSDDATHVRVHRVKQISGSGLGEGCPLILKVDNKEVAGLQQNQYADLFLPGGKHTLSVRFKCALTEWRKSIDLEANGNYQEYETELGAAGQYRMWQTK
ncbi:hypothetical protein [Erwinia sp. 9145]|uniref:hypothetical protein n=1 Tax=Erwinia sp. 9145 TaxID=1500895 RepID=UPI00054D24E4|nr:hypothetical protein [Erwinia sp. 9145]